MKSISLALLALAVPCVAQTSFKSAPTAGHWNLGIIRQAPSFTGSYEAVDNGQLTRYDTEKDLGLGKDRTGLGLLADYEGRRFRLHLAMYQQDYAGDRQLSRDTTIDGTTYQANAQVKSALKLRNYELDWTIKVYRWDAAYLGVDLGFNAWNLELSAEGMGTVSGNPTPVYQTATSKGVVPIPQLGLSAGGHIGTTVDLRAYYHLLSRSGATYHRAGADVRYFPLRWLGIRANFESEGFDVPRGSIDDQTAFKLDKNGLGLGVVFRF